MSRRTTKARRAAQRRRRNARVFALDAVSPAADASGRVYHWDPWGRPCGLGTWSYWFESRGPERFLAKTWLPNGYVVSTIWEGLDHSFGHGPGPTAWETGVLVSGHWQPQQRYPSRPAALAGHKEVVAIWARRPKLEVVSATSETRA